MTFRTGVISDETGDSVTDWLRWAKETPVNGVEIRTGGAEYGYKYPHLLVPSEARELGRRLTDAGLKVHALAAGLGKCDLKDTVEVKTHINSVGRLVENAGILCTNHIRAFAGWRTRDLPAMWGNILAFFAAVLKKVPLSIRLCIENEPATGCSTLGDVARLASALGNDKRIGAIYDPGNLGYDVSLVNALRLKTLGGPGHEVGRRFKGPGRDLVNALIQAEVREYGDIIRLVHAKNTCLGEDGVKTKTVKLDGGMVDFLKLFGLLKKQGIDVSIDLEPHRAPKGKQLAEEMRATPGGPGYAHPPNATEDFVILTSMLKELK